MSTIDIRQVEDPSEVAKIIFSDGGCNYATATHLTSRAGFCSAISIHDETGADVVLESVAQVENLIKALKKAVELGWVT